MTCIRTMLTVISLATWLAANAVFAATDQSAPGEQQIAVDKSEELSADQIVSFINAVDEGGQVSRTMTMNLVDRQGKVRSRTAVNYRKHYPDEMRTALFFLEPANIRDTGFLIWDYNEYGREDDQWLYLPAMRKVRRISASNRGDYFLGTDFTYEDMKLDGKLEPLDYDFSLLGTDKIGETDCYKIQARPKDDDIAEELGYSRSVICVDPTNWIILRTEFWDLKGNLLKTLTVDDIRQVDGIWTRHQLRVANHQTGHKTEFLLSDVDYLTPVEDNWFTKMALARGR